MYGSSSALYQLSDAININKLSHLIIDLEILEEFEEIQVCVFEDAEDVKRKIFTGDESRCTLDIQTGTNVINIGSFFEYRRTKINFIAFIQRNDLNPQSGESRITKVSIDVTSNKKPSLFDANGECIDINARSFVENGNQQCVCHEGFVASNGGTKQGRLDTCVRCLDCALDGNACTLDRDCMTGKCVENVCESRVSSIKYIYQAVAVCSVNKCVFVHFLQFYCKDILLTQGGDELSLLISGQLQISPDASPRTVSSSSSSNEGGSAVQMDGSVLLYGDTDTSYTFSQKIFICKFSRFTLSYSKLEPVHNIHICLSDQLNGNQYPTVNMPTLCSSRCFVPQEGYNEINIGKMFGDRLSTIDTLVFHQTRGKSKVGALHVFNVTETKVINDLNQCSDSNARRAQMYGCWCFDGFASSAGGKLQGQFDTCLSCLHHGGSECPLDFDTISLASDCFKVRIALAQMTLFIYLCLRRLSPSN